MSRWNKNNFSIYTSEEKSVLGLLDELGSQVNHNTDNLNSKTDLFGDHKGSWQGLNRPTLSEEGMRATVEKLENEVKEMKVNVDSMMFSIQPFEEETEVKNIYKPWFNVERYGAVPDGITDCTKAIQKAFDYSVKCREYANFSYDTTITFGKGDYRVNNTIYLNLPNWYIGVSFKGVEGKYNMMGALDSKSNQTRIIKETDGAIFKINLKEDGSAFSGDRTHGNVSFKYFNFYCRNEYLINNTVCEYFRTRLNVEQVVISNFKQGFISINKDVNNIHSYSDFCIFDRVISIYARGTQISTYMNDNGKIINCQFSHMDCPNIESVILVSGGNAITLDNNIFTQTHVDGKSSISNNYGYIKVTSAYNVHIKNTYCERVAMENIITLHNVQCAKIDGITVQHTVGDGNGNAVRVHSCKAIDISRINRRDTLKEGYYDIYEFSTNENVFYRKNTCYLTRQLRKTQNIVEVNY